MIIELRPDNVDFAALVNKNNNGLTLNCKTKIITELQNVFNDNQQKWYIANFYIYLHYHPTEDYPIDLENVYRMIGFTTKGNAKRTLENNFTKDEDYKIELIHTDKRTIGGSIVEQIMLNTDTFKNLCMLIKTEKGKEIRKYYVKLENIFNKIVNEERLEYERKLKEKDQIIEQNVRVIEQNIQLIEEKEQELQEKDQIIEEKEQELITMDIQSELEKDILREKTLLEQFPVNTQCIYYGKIDNKSV